MRYISSVEFKAFDYRTEKRGQMLAWLLHCFPALQAKFTPELFVVHGQLDLLQWVINAGLFNLNASAAIQMSTLAYAQQRKLAKGDIKSAKSNLKLLMLIAAVLGEVVILQ